MWYLGETRKTTAIFMVYIYIHTQFICGVGYINCCVRANKTTLHQRGADVMVSGVPVYASQKRETRKNPCVDVYGILQKSAQAVLLMDTCTYIYMCIYIHALCVCLFSPFWTAITFLSFHTFFSLSHHTSLVCALIKISDLQIIQWRDHLAAIRNVKDKKGENSKASCFWVEHKLKLATKNKSILIFFVKPIPFANQPPSRNPIHVVAWLPGDHRHHPTARKRIEVWTRHFHTTAPKSISFDVTRASPVYHDVSWCGSKEWLNDPEWHKNQRAFIYIYICIYICIIHTYCVYKYTYICAYINIYTFGIN